MIRLIWGFFLGAFSTVALFLLGVLALAFFAVLSPVFAAFIGKEIMNSLDGRKEEGLRLVKGGAQDAE